MKAAVLGLVAVAPALWAVEAHAQSGLTLFGVADTGVRLVKNGDGQVLRALTNDGLTSSRIGFRGEEDLGGYRAGFWLEAGYALDRGTLGVASPIAGTDGTSQGSKTFNRRSTVSLSGPFGEIRLGRDFTPTYLNVTLFDTWGGIGLGTIMNLMGGGSLASVGSLGSNAGTLIRADNALAWFLPPGLGGVYGSVMASAGEGDVTSNGHNRYVGLRLGWATGPYDAAVGFGSTRIPDNGHFKTANLVASVKGPRGRVGAILNRSEFTPAGLPTRRLSLVGLSASVPFGALELRLAAQKSWMDGGLADAVRFWDGDDAHQFSAGAIYHLSKRTALYADVALLQNRGRSQLAIPGGTLQGSSFGSADDQRSRAADVGVRHSF